MSKAVCCRKFYSFLFSEYPCSSLISYQEFQQIVAISTHWPLSFPVARFRLCYLIGKHLNSTAGGGGGGREKLKCGPHFVVIYWNHYCAMFISANFTAWQFSFYHVCTVTLVYASYPEISFMHFEDKKMQQWISCPAFSELTKACQRNRKPAVTVAWIWPLGQSPHIEGKHTSGGFKLLKLEPAVYYIRQVLIYIKSNTLLITIWGFVVILNLKIYTNIFNSNLTAKIHISHDGNFMVEIEIIIN